MRETSWSTRYILPFYMQDMQMSSSWHSIHLKHNRLGDLPGFDIWNWPHADAVPLVLVHGEGHGGWCWFKLRWLLEGSGYRVTCIDLAGGGVNPTDPNTVRSFEQYDKPLLNLISALPEGEKVILIGHGIGGLSVIHAMHEFVDRIKEAIFVAAAMLPFGLQTDEDKKDGLPSLPENEVQSTFGAGADDPPTTVALRLEFQRDRLSQQSPEEDSILASMLMRPWPVSAIGTASFEGDDERLNRIKRVFIKTQRDHMLEPQQQDSMIKKWPPSEVLIIDTDHSPFFSAPEQLFNLIVKSL